MSTVVVDSNIALKWALMEADSAQAEALLVHWTSAGTKMTAPALFAYELANVLHQRTRKGVLTPDEARDALERLLAGAIELDRRDDAGLSKRALTLTQQLGPPATYDAHYLALAEREGCEYWTADELLWNVAHPTFGWVRLLREFAPPATP